MDYEDSIFGSQAYKKRLCMKYEIAYTFLDLAITPHYTDTVTQAQLLRPVITPD